MEVFLPKLVCAIQVRCVFAQVNGVHQRGSYYTVGVVKPP